MWRGCAFGVIVLSCAVNEPERERSGTLAAGGAPTRANDAASDVDAPAVDPNADARESAVRSDAPVLAECQALSCETWACEVLWAQDFVIGCSAVAPSGGGRRYFERRCGLVGRIVATFQGIATTWYAPDSGEEVGWSMRDVFSQAITECHGRVPAPSCPIEGSCRGYCPADGEDTLCDPTSDLGITLPDSGFCRALVEGARYQSGPLGSCDGGPGGCDASVSERLTLEFSGTTFRRIRDVTEETGAFVCIEPYVYYDGSPAMWLAESGVLAAEGLQLTRLD